MVILTQTDAPHRIAVIDTLSVDFSFTASIDSRSAFQTIHFSFTQLELDE